MPTSLLVSLLKRGGIAVIPTDTLYGIVASARNRKAVARLYRLRRNTKRKPFIVLVPHRRVLRGFGVRPTPREKRFLDSVWPGKVSVIFPCISSRFSHLHRGTKTLAFRVPKLRRLRELLRKTGALLAPSANPEGLPPAKTIRDAKAYFGDAVDVYAAGMMPCSYKPSTLVSFAGQKLLILRQGTVPVRELQRAWKRI